jgi:FtsP/CotA-like multicopper oxidase with cupredoxin domain
MRSEQDKHKADTDTRNFRYPNSALRINQSFPIFTTMITPNSSDEQTLMDWKKPSTHFDLAKATATTFPPSASMNSTTTIPREASQTILLYTKTQKLAQFSNHPMGFMNRTTWRPQSFPLLSLPRSSWDSHQLIPFIPLSSSSRPLWVDLIINNLDDGAHPFHLHGHTFYILASHRAEHGVGGWGSYSPYAQTGNSAQRPELNLLNPQRRDTVSVPRHGYVVLRFRADNPGLWMLHCHVVFHQASGMAMGLLVGGDEKHDAVDGEAKKLCGGDGG